ncbi:MAG: lipoprotein [Nitratireductor sp.]
MCLRRTVLLLAMLAVAGSLAACGRRSPPITPYEAALEKRADAEKKGEELPPAPEPPAADKPFILDGLID